jgi:hypothetical protein
LVEWAAVSAQPVQVQVEVENDPTRAASISMAISGIRCILAYIVFPWVLPAASRTKGVGPTIGLVVGVVAIGFNVASIRRFQRSAHRLKWYVMTLNCIVIAMLLVLVVRDIADLAG